MSALLEVEGLSVTFATPRGALRAVDGLSWSVAAGETLAIVGESGSGKSVSQMALFDLLPRAGVRVEARSMRFEGRELASLPRRERRALRGSRMALVLQDAQGALNPLMTVERQIAEVLEAHEGLGLAAARPRVEEALEAAGIASPRERMQAYPHELSGGLRQRVLIAQALVARPALVVADEPTSALDVTVQAQVLATFARLRAERRMALVLVTHSLGVVAQAADRVLVMYAGRAVETGPVERVLERPLHPYTRALLASVPRLDDDLATPLAALPGQPPDLARAPGGCAFAPRCPLAREACSRARPELRAFAEGRASACLLADEFAEAAR